MRREVLLRPHRPGVSQAHRVARALPRRRRLHALVEDHHHVRAQRDLHLHRVLRREEVQAAVQVRAELDAFLRHLAQLGQAEDLETARVGQQRPLPAHEAMQAAHAPDEFVPRPQSEVIGVGQNHLRTRAVRANLLQRLLRHRLHRRRRPHRHEDRRMHSSVGKVQRASPSARLRCRANFKAQGHTSSMPVLGVLRRRRNCSVTASVWATARECLNASSEVL